MSTKQVVGVVSILVVALLCLLLSLSLSSIPKQDRVRMKITTTLKATGELHDELFKCAVNKAGLEVFNQTLDSFSFSTAHTSLVYTWKDRKSLYEAYATTNEPVFITAINDSEFPRWSVIAWNPLKFETVHVRPHQIDENWEVLWTSADE